MQSYRLVLAAVVVSVCGCRHVDDPEPNVPVETSVTTPERIADLPGLHNVFKLTERLFSGSSPEGEDGFGSLKQLGVKTVLSVDGARPDVERARRHGLRYVHLPIGYDGVPREQGMRIAQAVRDLPGPIYIHCHHGKHRGPAAAATAWRCLDAKCTADVAVAWLKVAGTDPRYAGLYADVRTIGPPSPEELDRLSADFPEVAPALPFVDFMVRIDERWDHLKEVKAANWTVPPEHTDLDPPHEAFQLAEHFREIARLETVANRPRDFKKNLDEAEAAALAFEKVLQAKPVDPVSADREFARTAKTCTRCHEQFRNRKERPNDR